MSKPSDLFTPTEKKYTGLLRFLHKRPVTNLEKLTEKFEANHNAAIVIKAAAESNDPFFPELEKTKQGYQWIGSKPDEIDGSELLERTNKISNYFNLKKRLGLK